MSMFVEGYLAEKERCAEAPKMLSGPGGVSGKVLNNFQYNAELFGKKVKDALGNASYAAKDTWSQAKRGVIDGTKSGNIASITGKLNDRQAGLGGAFHHAVYGRHGDSIPVGGNPFKSGSGGGNNVYRGVGQAAHGASKTINNALRSEHAATAIMAGSAAVAIGATAYGVHKVNQEFEKARQEMIKSGKKNPTEDEVMKYIDDREEAKRKASIQGMSKGKHMANVAAALGTSGGILGFGYAPTDNLKTSAKVGLAGAIVGGMTGAYLGGKEWDRVQAEKNAQKPPKRESTGNPLFDAYNEEADALRENVQDKIKGLVGETKDWDGGPRAASRLNQTFSANRAGQTAYRVRTGAATVAERGHHAFAQGSQHAINAVNRAGDAVKGVPGAMKTAGQAVAGAVTRHPVAAGAAAAGLGLVGAAALARKAMSSLRDKGNNDPSDDDFHSEMNEHQNGISNGGDMNKNAQGMGADGKRKLPPGKKMVFGRVVDVQG